MDLRAYLMGPADHLQVKTQPAQTALRRLSPDVICLITRLHTSTHTAILVQWLADHSTVCRKWNVKCKTGQSCLHTRSLVSFYELEC